MGRNRFVQPTITRLDLTDGDWIEIKTELNAGERRHAFGRLVKEMRAGENAMLDPEQVGLTRLAEYIVAWSFVDASGQAVPVSEAAINALDVDSFGELVAAIDKHEAAHEAKRSAEKKDSATSMASAAT